MRPTRLLTSPCVIRLAITRDGLMVKSESLRLTTVDFQMLPLASVKPARSAVLIAARRVRHPALKRSSLPEVVSLSLIGKRCLVARYDPPRSPVRIIRNAEQIVERESPAILPTTAWEKSTNASV